MLPRFPLDVHVSPGTSWRNTCVGTHCEETSSSLCLSLCIPPWYNPTNPINTCRHCVTEPRLLGLKYFDPARRQPVEAAIIGRQAEYERDCQTKPNTLSHSCPSHPLFCEYDRKQWKNSRRRQPLSNDVQRAYNESVSSIFSWNKKNWRPDNKVFEARRTGWAKLSAGVTSFRVISRSPYEAVNGIFLPAVTRLYWTINVSTGSLPRGESSFLLPSVERRSLSFPISSLFVRSLLSVSVRPCHFSCFCLCGRVWDKTFFPSFFFSLSFFFFFFKSGDTASTMPGAGAAGGMRYFGIMSVDGRATG